MLSIARDREKELDLLINNSEIEVRSYDKNLKVKYRIDSLQSTVVPMMKLFKLEEKDLYSYSLDALNKLIKNTKDLKVRIQLGKGIEVKEGNIFYLGKKCTSEQVKSKMSAKELFISVMNKCRVYVFNDDKLPVREVEHVGVKIKNGEIVKKDNKIKQIVQINVILDDNSTNRTYCLINYWGADKAELERFSDLVRYKNSIKKEEKERYIKKRNLIGDNTLLCENM